jgi:hypothetical protein
MGCETEKSEWETIPLVKLDISVFTSQSANPSKAYRFRDILKTLGVK